MSVSQLISTFSFYAIIALVILSIVYMYFYQMLTKDQHNQPDDKYKAIYEIASLIVHNFDPAQLTEHEIVQKALPHVKNQAEKDGLAVTDHTATGAIKKAINAQTSQTAKPAQPAQTQPKAQDNQKEAK